MLFAKKRGRFLWLLEIYSEDERYSVEYLWAEKEIFLVVDEFDRKDARIVRRGEDKLSWSLRENKKNTKRNNPRVEHDTQLKFYEWVYTFIHVIIRILLHFKCL